MLTDRILMILRAGSASETLDTLESAFAGALLKKRLSFGLLLDEAPDPAMLELLSAYGNIRYMTEGGAPCTSLWQGEKLIFTAASSVTFLPQWDMSVRYMLNQLSRSGIGKPVLTGLPPLEDGAVDAFSPVGIGFAGKDGTLTFRRGTPFLRGREPMQAAVAVPGFCCAPSSLFRLHEQQQNTALAVTAFRNGFECYTPQILIARSGSDLLPEPLILPREDADRFGKRFGLNTESGVLSGQARTGCHTPDLSWPEKTPLLSGLRRFSSASLKTAASDISLFCITTLLDDCADPDLTPEESSIAFRRLASLNNLVLLCYTNTVYVETARLKHPNVLEYRDEYGIPVHYRPGKAQYDAFLRLSRPFLLAKSAERFPGHTHLAWVDPDCVPYPPDPDTVPDLTSFCTDRIVIGTVDGDPDLSTVIIPEQLLSALCGEICLICGTDSRLVYQLPPEKDLWKRLIDEHPDRFTLIPVTEKHGLMAAMLGVGQTRPRRRNSKE
ncbi:MAG: hypothetical protein MJ142_04355 [Clostridia bacterium]|nr:hypothetical protein [Clostridia bacterium]